MKKLYGIKILILDNSPVFRHGFIDLIQNLNFVNCCYEANNEDEAQEIFNIDSIDLLIIDFHVSNHNNNSLLKNVKKKYSNCKILILFTKISDTSIYKYLNLGIANFASKNINKKELELVITNLVQEGIYVSKDIKEIWVTFLEKIHTSEIQNHIVELSGREQEIIKLICQEYTTNQIANKLFISPVTVNNHRANILKKINRNNVVSIVLYAIRNGIVSI